MENIMIKKDFEIEKSEDELDNFFDPLTREEQRDIFTNNIDIDEDTIIYMLEKSQTTLLNKLKDFNKYNIRVNDLIKEKKMLQNILKKLKENKSIKDFSLDEQNILLKKVNPKKNNITIQNEHNIDNSGIKTLEGGNISILSDIMNDTINSEYEEEDYIEFITDQKNYKPLILTSNLRNKIPSINLQQIEYNKMKFKQEYREKSLSRELKNMDEFDIKKELLKSLIKKEKFRNKKLSNKCSNYQQKINMMKKIIKSMIKYNYDLCQSAFRDKILGNNVQRQFNPLSGRNHDTHSLKLNFDANDDFNKAKINSKEQNEIIINDISINKNKNKNIFG
jgi:Cu/Ag efflux protein CusF